MVSMSTPAIICGTMCLTCGFVCTIGQIACGADREPGWSVAALVALFVLSVIWIVEAGE